MRSGSVMLFCVPLAMADDQPTVFAKGNMRLSWAVVLAGLTLVASRAVGANYVWVGGTGDWRNAANWTGGTGVPGTVAGDTVVVTNGQATLDGPLSQPLASLTVVDGGLVMTGLAYTLDVTAAPGTVTVGANGVVTIAETDWRASDAASTADAGLPWPMALSGRTVVVETLGVIDANGRGGRAAFSPLGLGADGDGPVGSSSCASINSTQAGASHAGWGGSFCGRTGTYGDPFRPSAVGTGGATRVGETNPGGNGGGRVALLGSQSIRVDGVVTANGQLPPNLNWGEASAGSGGSLLFITPQLEGTGELAAKGEGNSSGGRIGVVGVSTWPLASSLLVKLTSSSASGGAPGGTLGVTMRDGARHLRAVCNWRDAAMPITPAAWGATLSSFSGSGCQFDVGDGKVLEADVISLTDARAAFRVSLFLKANVVTLTRVASRAEGCTASPVGQTNGYHGGVSSLMPATGAPYGSVSAPSTAGSSFFCSGSPGGAVAVSARQTIVVDSLDVSGDPGLTGRQNDGRGGAGGSVWLAAPVVSVVNFASANGAPGTFGNAGGGRVVVAQSGDPLMVRPFLSASRGGSDATAGSVSTPVYLPQLVSDAGLLNPGVLQFQPLATPGLTYEVYLNEDLNLGRQVGVPVDTRGDPMLTFPASSSGVVDLSDAGLIDGRSYFWHVAAFDSVDSLVAASGFERFIKCPPGATCVFAPVDAGLVFPGRSDAGTGVSLADGGVTGAVAAPRFAASEVRLFDFGCTVSDSLDLAEGMGVTYRLEGAPEGLSIEAGDRDLSVKGALEPGPREVLAFDVVASNAGGEARVRVRARRVCNAVSQVGCACNSVPAPVLLFLLLLAMVRARRRSGPLS